MIKLTEATIALYCALQERNHCKDCNGSGINWVQIDDGHVDAELCDCAVIAKHALEHYRSQYEIATKRYFAERDIALSTTVEHENLILHLFGDVI